MKMFIITRCVNAYDQYGEYFFSAFNTEPKLSELAQLFYKKELDKLTDDQIMFLTNLKRGGGRQHVEDTWYHLHEQVIGKEFNPKT